LPLRSRADSFCLSVMLWMNFYEIFVKGRRRDKERSVRFCSCLRFGFASSHYARQTRETPWNQHAFSLTFARWRHLCIVRCDVADNCRISPASRVQWKQCSTCGRSSSPMLRRHKSTSSTCFVVCRSTTWPTWCSQNSSTATVVSAILVPPGGLHSGLVVDSLRIVYRLASVVVDSGIVVIKTVQGNVF